MTAILDKNKMFIFIKFSNNKQHLIDLQKGMLYMNNGKYFIEREEINNEKGIGDKHELSQVINDVTLKGYRHGTKDLLFIGQAARISIRANHFLIKPIFCLTQISADSLMIVKEYEDSVDCQFNFDAITVEKITKDFGELALLINPSEFLRRIEIAFKEQKIEFVAQKVKYEDYSINSQKRLEAYDNNSPELFFYKDLSFAYQKEYRIVITNIDSEQAFVCNVGDLSSITYLLSTQELFSDKFTLNISKK